MTTEDAYTIRYSHTGAHRASTLAEAQDEARDEAMRVCGSAGARRNVVFVRCDDGIYAYLDQASADADQVGDAAFAVISRPDQDAD